MWVSRWVSTPPVTRVSSMDVIVMSLLLVDVGGVGHIN
jgi:hypothetical protein